MPPGGGSSGPLTLDKGFGKHNVPREMPALGGCGSSQQEMKVRMFAGVDTHKVTVAVAVIDHAGAWRLSSNCPTKTADTPACCF